jgi:hypothetical protein
VEDSNFTATKERTTSLEQCQISVDFFFGWGDIEGIVHIEFFPTGHSVNEKLYCYVLRRLRENNRRNRPNKWRNNSWVLHHDIALAHALLVVQQFLVSTNMTVIPHPSYSPELAACDFFLFPKIKLKLKVQRFDSNKEIQTVLQNVMKT